MHAVVAPERSGALPTFFGELFHNGERHIGHKRPWIAEGVVIRIEIDRGSPGVDGERGASPFVSEIVAAAVVLGGLHDLARACPALADGGEDAQERGGDFFVASGFGDALPAVEHGKRELDCDEVALIPRLAVELTQPLAGREWPGIRRRHEALEMLAASGLRLRPPEAIGRDPDRALHALDLFGCHRVRKARARNTKEMIMSPRAI